MNKENKIGVICLKCENKFQNLEVYYVIIKASRRIQRTANEKGI
jgi:hypothetical protein